MKVEYVMPFLAGSINVLKQISGQEIKRGQLGARPQMFTSQQINIVCGITGDVYGQVIYGMASKTAHQVATKMIGMPVTTFDQLAASAIAELGNMISGNSATGLTEQGFDVDITPPTIIKGANVRIATMDAPALVIPVTIGDIGDMEINVSLQTKAEKAAA
ncbi:MAG: chemotaxis protein CheX [Fimbriimonadaceae bacterium]|nr:chemotaxis protein CheX [Armatimonadota bacterium]